MPRATLRSQLVLLAVAGVLPLALISGLGLLYIFHDQRDQAHQRALEITRALATAVDAELQRSFAALHVLAGAPAIDRHDLDSFERVSRRTLATQPRWRSVILASPDGAVLVNTGVRTGPLPELRERESFDAAVATMKPQVGRLVRGSDSHAFALRVPVIREGRVLYVVGAVVDPGAILDIVTRQRVAGDWVISVFDTSGNRVARSRAHERFLGTPAAESLRSLMARSGSEGMAETRALEGDSVFTAFTRSPLTGWSVAIGLPTGAVTQLATRTTTTLALAVAFSLLVGFLAAAIVARRINRPITQLRRAAELLGRGGEPPVPETGVREIHDVGEALSAAARERMDYEREREELLRREQQARELAEEANRSKDQFLAMLGHELRNPLAAIASAAGLLEHARNDQRVTTRAREVIQRQVAHLARLTDDLLDAARALLGKVELRREPVNLARVATVALDTLAGTGRSSQHHIEERIEDAWVMGDEVRLDQIASNLLVNAIKYTPPGGRVTVSTGLRDGQAFLRVSDTGSGLSPALAQRAFDLFVQGQRQLDRAQGGLGIGLTLVRRLAELHGGSATVHSEGENRGAEFVVRLPAIEPPAAQTGALQARVMGAPR